MPAVVRSFQEKKDNPKYRATAEAFAQKHGISLDDVIFVKDFDDEGNPVSDDVEVRQRTSILGSIGKEFAAGVAPTAAATLAGGAVGAATTVATAPKLGPLAPVAGGAAGLTTALGTGIAGDLLARKALKTYIPSWNRELEIANQSHPNWSMVGGVLSGGVAQRNLPRHLIGAALKRGTAKSFGERVALDPVIKEVIPAGQKFTTAIALNLATSVGAGAGGDIAMQMANAVSTPGKQDIDYWRSIKAGLLAPIAGGGAPRFGRKLMMEPARRIAAGQMRTAAGEAPVTVPPGTDRKAAAKAYQEALKKAPDDATRGRITAEMAENYSFTPESVDAYLAKIDQQDAAAAEKTPTKGQVEDAIVDQDMVKWLITNKRLNVGGKQKKMTTAEAEEFLQNPESAAFKEAYRVAKEAEKSASPPEKPAAPTTETTDAVPKQSTETLPPLETPKVGETVGGKVPSTKGTAREEGGPTVPPKTEVTPEIISEAEKIVGERLVHLPSKSASALWKEHGGGLFEKLRQTDKAKWMDEGGKLAPDTIWNYFEELVRTKSGAIKRGDAARFVSDPDQKIAEAVAAGKELPPPEPRAKNSLPPAEAVPPRPNPLPEVPRGPEFNPIKNPAHKTFEGVLKQLGETEASYTRKIEDSPWVPDKTGVPVKQGTSAIEGIGNFTTQDLQAGAEIAPAFVPSETNPKEFIRTATGRFTNHSDSPNARIENIYGPDGVRSMLIANRGLKAGEELTIDYVSAAKMIEELDSFLKSGSVPVKSKVGKKVVPAKPSVAKPLEVPREPTVERPQDIPAADRKARLEAAWDATKAYGEDLAKSGKEVSPLSVAAKRALTAATEYLPDKEAFHIASLFTKHLKAGGAKDKAIADVLRYLKSAEKKAISKEGQPVKAAVKKARKPITGEAGALGAWGDVARSIHNVASDATEAVRKLVAKAVLHTTSPENVASILKTGLRRGSNITFTGGESNQSLGYGITLVYPPETIQAVPKSYQANEGLVAGSGPRKPVAILVYEDELPTRKAYTVEEVQAKLEKLITADNKKFEEYQKRQAQMDGEYNTKVKSLKVEETDNSITISEPSETARGQFDPRTGGRFEDAVISGRSVTFEKLPNFLKKGNTRYSLQGSPRERALSIVSEEFFGKKPELKQPWQDFQEQERLQKLLDEMDQKKIVSLPEVSIAEAFNKLGIPSEVPAFVYSTDENGNIARAQRLPTARLPLTGEIGALGGLGDVARATHNVAQDIITGAKKAGNKIGEVLREINKGFEAGRNAADRPSFISAAVVDALRPGGDELYSFPPHIIFAKMSQAIGKLVGKPAMFMTKRLARGAGEALRELHPVMGNYIMDNTIPTFQLEQRKMFNEFLAPLYEAGNLKLSREQWNKIGQYSIDMDEYGASAITLSAEELKGYNYTRASYDASKLAQDADGPTYSGRAAHLTENFYPNSVLSEKVRKILMSTNKEDAAERNRIVALQRDWHRRQDPKATTKDMDAHLAALLGKGVFLGKRDPTFSPLFKAEGIGIHPDLRETHAFKVAQFYGMRSATGLAWYRAVQKDPIAARIFGVANNGKGKSYVSPETDTIDPTMLPGSDGDFAADAYEIKDYSAYPEYARNLSHDPSVEYFRSEMGLGLRSNYDWVDQATALVNSMKLGPRTVLRDVLASLPISIETATSAEVAKYWGPALEKVILGKSEATKVGAVRAKDTAEMAIDNTVRNTMGKITDVMRKYQGRDLFERGIREVLYEFYHSVADARLKANDVEFLEAWGGKKWKDYTPDVLLPRMATKLMENVQGNYTGEYLPAAIGKGAAPNFLKTTFSLSRWSIERMRRYRQTVLKPLAEKGDWKPFLRSSFMHQFFAAPAVAAIEQFITGLKPQELTWAEWLGLAKDDGRPDDNKLDELAYTILAKAQLTGMGGMLSSLALNAYQLKHGEATYGFQNPFWQSAEDLVGRILQFWGTHSGPELLLAPFSIPLETVLQETQTARLLRNRIKKVGETGMREEKIWKRMTGQTSPGMASFMRGNPWDPKRRISRAQSMEEIVKEIPGLVKSYKEYTPGGPTRFAKRERPLDYYSFLKTIQGTPAAAGQFQRDIQNDTLNTLRDAAARAAFTTAVEDKTPLERLQLNRRISR